MPSNGPRAVAAAILYALAVAAVAVSLALVAEFAVLGVDLFAHHWVNVAAVSGAISFVLALTTVWRFRGVLIDRKALRHASMHDYLTGAGNRAYFFGAFEGRPPRAMTGAALIAFDLDAFKAINDALGHHAGDEVLVEVVRRMRAVLPEAARVARFGGDEFLVLLPAGHVGGTPGLPIAPGDGAALAVTEALRHAITGRPVQTARGSTRISASFGVVEVAGQEPLDTLLRRADAALYQAKHAGGGRSVLFERALAPEEEPRAEAERTARVGGG